MQTRWGRAGRTGAAAVLAASFAFGASGCAPAPQLRMPVEQLHARVRTMCVLPIRHGLSFEGVAARVQAFEAIFLQELHRTPWKVVLPADCVEVANRVSEDFGGTYDPVTGEQDEARRVELAARTRTALRAELGCDATLQPSIAIVTAPWVEGKAQWDGVHELMQTGTGAAGFTTALSLWVRIADENDQELFFGTGGIHLLARLVPTGFARAEFMAVAEDRILADPGRTYLGVRAALAPFLTEDPGVGVERYGTRVRDLKKRGYPPMDGRSADREVAPGDDVAAP